VKYEKLAIRRFLLEDDMEKFGEKEKIIFAHVVNFRFYKVLTAQL
jgi:hypothetical protein